MAHTDQRKPLGSTGPLIASAIIGVVLGGAIAIAAGEAADSTSLPTDEQIAVSKDNAFLGSVEYGGRNAN